MNNQNIEQADVIIIGGGIAGLWLFNRLKQRGLHALLLEKNALGGGQTIKAQGIIHGGIKYALQGKMTSSAVSISTMPKLWRQCLEGQGEIDLSQVPILSPYHYLWSINKLRAKLNQFLANQVLSSHSEAIQRDDYPAIFQHQEFKGKVYRVKEDVLDVPKLVDVLSQFYPQSLLKIDSLEVVSEDNNNINHIVITEGQRSLTIKARYYIFTAGENNEQLTQSLQNAPRMQRRALHMVVVKLPFTYQLYAHCIGVKLEPRLTITTHQSQDGKCIWYLGGQIAEEGIHRTPEAQIKHAQAELNLLFPWLDFTKAQFASFFVDRAELKQSSQTKPDSCTFEILGNVITGWPTKLAFAPLLSQKILGYFDSINFKSNCTALNMANWPTPLIAKPVWDELLP